MSYSFDGANDRMTGTFASTYAEPVTLACWTKVTGHPLAVKTLLQLGNSSTRIANSYWLRTAATDDTWAARAESTGGSGGAAAVTHNIDGVWAGFVGRFTNESSRDVFVQALANTGSDTLTLAVADALQFIRVGETLFGDQDFAGLLAEVAIWNKALSDAEITSYLGGTPASSIAAANLIGYWPLSASNATQANQGTDAGGDLTVTGATFDADHPTITQPGGGKLRIMMAHYE